MNDIVNGQCIASRKKSSKCIVYQGSNYPSIDIHYGEPLNLVIGALVDGIGNSGTGDMKSSIYDPTGVNGDAFDYNNLTNTPTLFDGDYNSLSNKPSIPTTPGDIGAQPAGDYATTSQLFSGNYGDLNNAPTLSTVATSGSYNDLTNKPTLFSGSYNDLSDTPVLGTAASSDVGDFATSAQGAKADSAVQPGDLGNTATITVPTADPADGVSIWLDGSTLKIASAP